MIRTSFSVFCSCVALLAAISACAPAATAGPHLLPRIRLPKINLGKAADALAYPVKKSVVNGGKTVLNTAITIETGRAIDNLAPASPGGIARKIIVWGVGKH